jgi:hypothetical protein
MKVKTQQDYDNLEIVDPCIKSVNILDGWAVGRVITKQDKVTKETCYEVWITDGVCHEESYGATSLDNIDGIVNWLTALGNAMESDNEWDAKWAEERKVRSAKPEFILYTTVNGYCGEHGELSQVENEQPTIDGLVSDGSGDRKKLLTMGKISYKEWQILESQGK